MNDPHALPAVAPLFNGGQPSYETAALRLALGLASDKPFNLGALLSDRLCVQGHGDRLLFVWEKPQRAAQGTFTLMICAGTATSGRQRWRILGIVAGDRVCLFLDRVPDPYFAFLGILKLGAVAQPLFSQFMADALEVRLPTGHPRGHHHGPTCRKGAFGFVFRPCRAVLGDPHRRQTGRLRPSSAKRNAIKRRDRPPRAFTPLAANDDTPRFALHLGTRRPKGAQHRATARLLSQFATTRHVLISPRGRLWFTADPGWVTGTPTASSVRGSGAPRRFEAGSPPRAVRSSSRATA